MVLRSRVVGTSVCLMLAPLLVACTSSTDGSGTTPSASNSVGITPTPSQGGDIVQSTQAPAGFRQFTSGRVTLSVPQGWEDKALPESTAARGEKVTTIGFRPPGGDKETWQGLSVILTSNDPTPVLDSSTVLENLKKDVERATDVSRRAVKWPGATQAVVVDWTQPVEGASVRYRQLMLQIGPAETVTVIALTRADAFEGGDADQALRTVQITPAASVASG